MFVPMPIDSDTVFRNLSILQRNGIQYKYHYLS